MSSCTAKATHIFFSKKFQNICVSLDVNFNESLTNDVVSFEQLGPAILLYHVSLLFVLFCLLKVFQYFKYACKWLQCLLESSFFQFSVYASNVHIAT